MSCMHIMTCFPHPKSRTCMFGHVIHRIPPLCPSIVALNAQSSVTPLLFLATVSQLSSLLVNVCVCVCVFVCVQV